MLLGLGWNFLFVSGTSLLILSYEPHEKFKAQGLNDFSVFTTQATGALLAGASEDKAQRTAARQTKLH